MILFIKAKIKKTNNSLVYEQNILIGFAKI